MNQQEQRNKFQGKYIKPGVKLFDEQKMFVKRLVHRRRCILSGKTGAGKTLSVLYAFSYLKEMGYMKRLFVLTPLSAYEKDVWKKDIAKFTTFKCIDIDSFYKLYKDAVPAARSNLLDYYDVIYGKHTHVKARDYVELCAEIISLQDTLCCIDEVHAFRNPTSKLTLALKEMTRCSRAFWGITATTISRNIQNLYDIVNLVYPWYLGPWTMFRDTYCNTMQRCIGYRGGKKAFATETTTIKDPVGLRAKLEPIMITGESFFDIHFHYEDYRLSPYEEDIYSKITDGIAIAPDELDPDVWFKSVISGTLDKQEVKSIGDVERYSSRFIYLQHAADGIIANDGTYTRMDSVKMLLLMERLQSIIDKNQSVLVYFDYLASVDAALHMCRKHLHNCNILVSTGDDKLKEGTLTEGKCKMKPHVVLCTRASSESASYYFINNVVFFHVPTVPSTFVQMLGRITRKNSLYPDDLNCFIFRSENIDLYKLLIVSGKTRLMEIASGEEERNVPPDYKEVLEKSDAQQRYKRILLWKQ